MAQLTVRKLHDRVKERLKARARRHGRTLEAEARSILEGVAACEPPERSAAAKQPLANERSFGALMHERFGKTGLTVEEARQFQRGIDRINRR